MTYSTLLPADLPVQWQGISEHVTQRGRAKSVLTGIPGPLFWHRWKHDTAWRTQLRDSQIAPRRLGKGQWEVVIWLNARNVAVAESLGFKAPAAAPVQDEAQPF